MELTQLIKKHKVSYNGDWSNMYCEICGKTFIIGVDMCDSEGILKELKRIDRIPCIKKKEKRCQMKR